MPNSKKAATPETPDGKRSGGSRRDEKSPEAPRSRGEVTTTNREVRHGHTLAIFGLVVLWLLQGSSRHLSSELWVPTNADNFSSTLLYQVDPTPAEALQQQQ